MEGPCQVGDGARHVGLGIWLVAPQPSRLWAGRALAAYLIGVFPANVYVAVAGVDVTGQPGGIYPWLRLPLQGLFVAWALWVSQSSSPRTRPHRGRLAEAGDHATIERQEK